MKENRFTVRMPEETRTMIKYIAKIYKTSESEALRILVQRGLKTMLPENLHSKE